MTTRRGLSLAVAGLAVASLILGACSSDPAEVNVQAPLDRGPDDLPDGITVSAVGEVEGAPDTMTVSIGVSLKRPTVQAAVDESATLATALLDAARANGVAEEDVQTREYSVSQEFRYPENSEAVPDGFRVSNVVVVEIRDLTKAGATIDAMTAAGGDATVLQSVAFSLEEDAAALDAARADAMGQARAKAEQLAELSGATLGPAQAISDQPLSPTPVTYYGDAGFRAADGVAATPISPGEVTSSVTVRVRYTLT